MSLPDAFIPFYGNDFFQAVEGEPDAVALGYLRAIWYYWNHNHCQGLRDDSEYLRKICRIECEYWDPAMKVIFDNDKMFTLGEDGKWHQKRAAELWNDMNKKYAAAVDRANKMNQVRWKGKA